MATRKGGNDVDQRAAIVDVQLLDVLAQIEALLRNGREVQRELLRVRGVLSYTTPDQQRKAAARVQTLVSGMLSDSRALSKVVRELRGSTNRLARHVRETASQLPT
jgi:uncharacterized protein YoaH (UPF0181 family)